MIRRTIEVKYKQAKKNLTMVTKTIGILGCLKDYDSHDIVSFEFRQDARTKKITLVEVFKNYSSMPKKNKTQMKKALKEHLINAEITNVKITEKEE